MKTLVHLGVPHWRPRDLLRHFLELALNVGSKAVTSWTRIIPRVVYLSGFNSAGGDNNITLSKDVYACVCVCVLTSVAQIITATRRGL